MMGGGYSLQTSQSQALDLANQIKAGFNYNGAMNVGRGSQTANQSASQDDTPVPKSAGTMLWVAVAGAFLLVAIKMLQKKKG